MTFDHLKPKSAKSVQVHLIRGLSGTGEKIYTYLAIYAHRVRDLKLSLITKTTDLDKFGVILLSGLGEPDDATKHHIQQTYFKADPNEDIS